MKRLSVIFCYIFIVIMLFYGMDMQAQTDPPPPPDGGGPGEVDDVPIDDFLVYAIILSVYIGAWVVRSFNSNQTD